MTLDFDVTLGMHGQVEACVAAQGGQHVVVERHSGADVRSTGAVEIEFDDDVGFLGLAFHMRAAGHFAP
jgi:hypothetical protein